MMRLSNISRQLIVTALCAAGLLTIPSAAQAPNDIRIALIIGNAAYPGNMALANPSNDAKDMAASLRNMGFGVIEVLDGNRAQMLDAIERANKQLQGKQGVGMLFYAGHGLQLDWRNYMVPVDAKLNAAADVPKQTIDIEVVMKSFQQAGNRMNIVVLDACRDDPFASQSTNGKTSTGKGLAPVDAPTGTFLAYATAPGNVAQDGTGKNGLYTGFLLQELQKPTARIEDVFKRVRFAVRKASNGTQIPWESTSLEDDFVFNSGIKKAARLTDEQKEKEFNIEKAEWDKIKDSSTVNDFYAFLQKFPTGNISSIAQHKLAKLQKDQTLIVADQKGLKGRSFFNSARNGDVFRFEVKDGVSGASKGFATITMKQMGDDLFQGVSDNRSVWAGAVIDGSGSLVADGNGGKFDPPMVVVPDGDLKVGNKDESRSIRYDPSGSSSWVQSSSKVVGRERIKTAFGEIETFKMEWIQKQQNGNVIKNTIWYDPEWVYAVRFAREVTLANGTVNSVVREMVERKRGG
jgi:hypothetical protein